jgi:RNA polymerase sigma factor (sigma-70 family)
VLAFRPVRRYPFLEVDDLVSEAYLELRHLALRFEPSRGASFSTFSQRRLAGLMKDQVRHVLGRNLDRRRIVNLDKVVLEEAPASKRTRKQLDAWIDIKRLSEGINPRWIYALIEHRVNGRQQPDIAREMNVNASRISQMETAAIARMRAKLEAKPAGCE